MSLLNASLFSQLLGLVSRPGFTALVTRTGSEKSPKGFASWDHFATPFKRKVAKVRHYARPLQTRGIVLRVGE